MTHAQQLIQGAERAARAVIERTTPPDRPISQTEILRQRVAALELIVARQAQAMNGAYSAPRNGIPADLCGTPVLLVPDGDDWHVHAYGCIDKLLTADQWLAAGHAWDTHVKQHNSEAAIERVMA